MPCGRRSAQIQDQQTAYLALYRDKLASLSVVSLHLRCEQEHVMSMSTMATLVECFFSLFFGAYSHASSLLLSLNIGPSRHVHHTVAPDRQTSVTICHLGPER